MTIIYKIAPAGLWQDAEAAGHFSGAPVDHADGFIHFSAAGQLRETASRYFHGVPDLLLIAVDAEQLGDALKWEPSRGGALFPHLFAPLRLEAVISVVPLPLAVDGSHRFPDDIP